MLEIKNQQVLVPGSKSYSHRILITTALADGISTISNLLISEDTLLTIKALKALGVKIEKSSDQQKMIVHGCAGRLSACEHPIFLDNSGTSLRLLTAVVAIGDGDYVLTGSERMQERPIDDLLDGLTQLGISAQSLHANGCPPLKIKGNPIKGGRVNLNCAVSSQYLSGLLLIGPYTQEGLDIHITAGPVSKPYIDMTIEVMERMGVKVEREGYMRFQVRGRQIFQSGTYRVEADASNASYFWAAAAITGSRVKVMGLNRDSGQGDIRFVEILADMGCTIKQDHDGLIVLGGDLRGINVDMADMPDMVPTLGVVAAFARGTTCIRNVGHLKIKECDRLLATANELGKMGIKVERMDDGLIIHGGQAKGAEIETYNDHRIAMSFAVAGLVVPGIKILNENCVAKSFPEFWSVFSKI